MRACVRVCARARVLANSLAYLVVGWLASCSACTTAVRTSVRFSPSVSVSAWSSWLSGRLDNSVRRMVYEAQPDPVVFMSSALYDRGTLPLRHVVCYNAVIVMVYRFAFRLLVTGHGTLKPAKSPVSIV